MLELTLQQQLRECASAARSAWPQLLQNWSWAELNEHDAIRRLLVRAVAWADGLSKEGARVQVRAVQALVAELDQQRWPEKAEPMRQLLQRCTALALQLAPLQTPPKIAEFDLFSLSDSARILLTVRAAERAFARLPKRAISSAQRATLRRAIDWAKAIGEAPETLEIAAAAPLRQAISALSWPVRSQPIVDSVICCLRSASNPWLLEQSQTRFPHLVADIQLQHALRAGVAEADIGRDYWELRQL